MNQANYFDLEQIFINELIGDVTLFIIIGLILIWFSGIKARVPYPVLGLISLIWVSIVYSIATATAEIFFLLGVLAVGFLFYFALSKIANR